MLKDSRQSKIKRTFEGPIGTGKERCEQDNRYTCRHNKDNYDTTIANKSISFDLSAIQCWVVPLLILALPVLICFSGWDRATQPTRAELDNRYCVNPFTGL